MVVQWNHPGSPSAETQPPRRDSRTADILAPSENADLTKTQSFHRTVYVALMLPTGNRSALIREKKIYIPEHFILQMKIPDLSFPPKLGQSQMSKSGDFT